MSQDIPVVILCGGLGTRMKGDDNSSRPKALVPIGDRPIIWHVMKIYSHYGFNHFVLCLGYQGLLIKDYFLNYEHIANDFTLTTGPNRNISFHTAGDENWTITFAETGLETNTGGRIKRIEKYIKTDLFMATYADGLADVDINELLAFHKSHGKIATMVSVHPFSNFGVVDLDEYGQVLRFREKPQQSEWINGGFFVLNREFFSYLDNNSILETEPIERLTIERQLAVFQHHGFWKCMDTFKDMQALNQVWNSAQAPWKIWKNQAGGVR